MFLFCKNLLNVRQFAAILLLIPALAIFSTEARAHAKMLRSQPVNGEVLRKAPKTVELEFNQKLQPGGVNSIFVTDENGGRVDKNVAVVFEDGKRLQTGLENLNSGTYKVEWKALSADEHLIKGSFTFKLALSTDEKQAVPMPSQADFQNSAVQQPVQESGMNWMQTAARWLTHLAMTLLFGGFAFLLLVLKPSLRMSPNLNDEERTAAIKRGKNLFISLAWLNLALLIVSAFAGLFLQTLVVYETSAANALTNLLRTLNETSYGETWLLQAFMTALLFAIVFFIDRKNRKYDSFSPEANAKISILWLGLVVCALLFLAPSLSGHARAASREYPFAVVSQWLHLIAVGVWLGGLFHLALILPRSIGDFNSRQRLSVLADAIPRFSRYAITFSLLLALTGVYSSWIHIKDFSDLWTSVYGIVLTAKIAVFILMLVLGGLNSFVLRPRLAQLITEADSESGILRASQNFYRAVGIEMALGAIALLLAAALAFAPLGHQH